MTDIMMSPRHILSAPSLNTRRMLVISCMLALSFGMCLAVEGNTARRHLVGDRIEVFYTNKKTGVGKWFPATYRGVDTKNRPKFRAVEYDDTPGRTLGAKLKNIRQIECCREYNGLNEVKNIDEKFSEVEIQKTESDALGVDVLEKGGYIKIVEVTKTALKSRIPVGSWISKIDGEICEKVSLEKVKQLLKKNSTIKVTFKAKTRRFQRLHFYEAWKRQYEAWKDFAVNNWKNGKRSAGKDSRWVLRETPDIGTFYQMTTRTLASDSSGKIKECVRRVDGEKFAIKVMDKTKLESGWNVSTQEQLLADLRHEVMMMMQVKHDHIMRVEEVFEDKQFVYIVMEHFSGGTLNDKLNKKGRLDEAQSKRILKQIFSALQCLHSQNIAHFNLKPATIWFKGEDHNEIRLSGFGCSKNVKTDHCTGLRGSSYFMAFEVVRSYHNKATYGVEADNWSMGIIAFRMMFGYPPFNAIAKRLTGVEAEGYILNEILGGFINKVKKGTGRWFPMPYHNFTSTDNCRDFIAKLLVKKPDERMTAQEALGHNWLVYQESEA